MAQQNLLLGTPNGKDGDFLRDAAVKIEANFTELYGSLSPTSIVGILGTKAEFDVSLTDGNFMYIGDTPTSHTHVLSAGATDVTATFGELNLLDLSGLTAGWVLSADTATTASWKAPSGGGTGDMLLGTAQTVTAAKTFNDTTFLLRNVANTFNGSFINTNSADRIYTLQDSAGTIAFTSDITGTNSGTNTGDQTTIVGITGTKTQFDIAITDGNFMYIGDAPTSHTHVLANVIDITALPAELNLLDLSGLTTGWVLSADSATTASWKAQSGGGSNTFLDNIFRIQDDGDVTKQIAFQASGITTGTIRTITMPNSDIDLANVPTSAEKTVLGNTSNTNTGDQTSIVGITGTKVEYDISVTDDDFAYQTDLDALVEELPLSSTIGASRDALLTDRDGINISVSASDVTITINSTVTFPQYSLLQYQRQGTGNIIIALGGTFTGDTPQTYADNQAIVMRYEGSNVWSVINAPINQNVATSEFNLQGNSIGGTVQTTTGDGATSIDWKGGNMFDFQFGAFNETFVFTAPTNPGTFILKLVQDSVGSRTATWPASVKWAGGSAPTLSTTATTGTDIITFYYNGTSYFAVDVLNFS